MAAALQIGRGLAGGRLFWVLLVLNVVATLAVAVATFHVSSGDHATYMGYVEGLLHGRYSYWYFYPDYIPDTFRNPGYPVFLLLLRTLGLGEAGIRVVQLGLYGATIGLLLLLARRCETPGTWLIRNLLLLLLLPNVQLAYFATLIFPEELVAFLLVVYAVVALTWPVGSWRRAVALGLLAGAVFQVRPVFILFPLAQLVLDYWRAWRGWQLATSQAVVLLLLFGATMLPYTLWNYRHHGVLKPTSLEGGAGVMQIGFWALRMPGYRETRYWGNLMGDELVQFADSAQVPGYIAAFNHEWDVVDARCNCMLTARDRQYLPQMRRDHPEFFLTYGTAYTLCRERELLRANLADIRREPGYYLQTRLYTLVRLWVTGVQLDAWRAATTPLAKIKVLYPTMVSGLTFLLALVSIGWAAIWGRLGSGRPTWRLALALVGYFGLVHLPFAIQARYTVPVRPWLLLATALALAAWLRQRVPSASAAQPAA